MDFSNIDRNIIVALVTSHSVYWWDGEFDDLNRLTHVPHEEQAKRFPSPFVPESEIVGSLTVDNKSRKKGKQIYNELVSSGSIRFVDFDKVLEFKEEIAERGLEIA